MSLSIARVSVDSTETERALRHVLEEVGVPASEHWTASITATRTGAWEVVLEGAPRIKCEHVDWEIVEHAGGTRFRKMCLGKGEQNVEHFKRVARKLIWESVQFKDNPIRNVSPKLGDLYEETVLGLLRNEDMNPVQVRFGVWREGPDGMKFVCKVEYASDRRVPWSWWSGLVRTPQDLASELQRALAIRRKRQQAASTGAAARRVRRAGAVMPPPAAAPPAGDGRIGL